MRRPLFVLALLAATACGGDGATATTTDPIVGVWSLQTYNGNPLPYTGTPDPDGAVHRVTGGEMEFNLSSYTLGIDIIRIVGGTEVSQDYSEFGTSTRTSGGLVLKPFDAPGVPSNLPGVAASLSNNSLSFVQDGKPLVFAKP